jgi:hypothetical protein
VRRGGERVARDQLTPLIRSEGEGGRGKHPNKVDSGMFGSARSIFYIERDFPAEREIGERENNWSVVHNISTIGNRTRFVC